MSFLKKLILQISNLYYLPFLLKQSLIVILEYFFNFFYFRRQKRVKIQKTTENKICFITGGTKGIGRKLVDLLKETGYKITVVGRTSVNIDGAKFIKLDLNNFTEIENLKYDQQIDLLILNAGIMTKKFNTIDINFKINSLSNFLLIQKLKNNLHNNTRIMLTTSCLALTVNSFNPFKKSIFMSKKYAESKLGVFLLGKYLSRNHQVVVVHPGIVSTELFNENVLVNFANKSFLYPFTNSLDESSHVLYNACQTHLENHHRLVFFYGFDRMKIPNSVNKTNLNQFLHIADIFSTKVHN